MLLRYWQQLLNDPAEVLPIILIALLGILVAITVHEFSHAFVALLLGDRTAKEQGRVTLNPLAHLDPMGSLMIVFVGFGWGKPVPFSPWRFRGNPRLSSSLVALAGPMSNFIAAVIIASVLRSGLITSRIVADALGTILIVSLLLGFFNLIPLFPLDGFNTVRGLLPPKLGDQFGQLAPWGPGILFALIGIGLFTDYSPISMILSPLLDAALDILIPRGRF